MWLLSAVNMPGIFLPPSLFLGSSRSLHQHIETHVLQLCLNSLVWSWYQALTVRGPWPTPGMGRIILGRLQAHWAFVWLVTRNQAASHCFGRMSKCLEVSRAISSQLWHQCLRVQAFQGKVGDAVLYRTEDSEGRYLCSFPEQANAYRTRNIVTLPYIQ